MKFCHLHVHSHYSLLDGLTKIDDLVEFAQEDGASAIALTDHGSMYGIIEFYKKCKKAGIKPIIGVEVYVAPGSRFDKNFVRGEKNYYHLLLLAKNNAGYKNLLKLTSLANLEGYYYKPRVDWELLTKHHEGLIACSACLGGEVPRLILSGQSEKARQRALDHAQLFGPDNYYLELQDHPESPENQTVNKALIALAHELNLPLVATNDSHYYRKEDDQAQDILLCLQNKSKKEDTNRMCMLGANYSLRPSKEMLEAFAHVPEAISNTVKIADSCQVEIALGEIQLPYFEVPAGQTGQSYLRDLCLTGLQERYGQGYETIDEVYRQRLDYELSVIDKMGWPSYFLIVADFVNWAKGQKIVVGPGRGSAAGSLVCYLIGITNLCPIKYDLLFERFLNPERISMPDIDLDFADARRGEVIAYVQKKYGEDHVAQIITFGTMAARAAIRDVGRVLDYPYDYCDKLAKLVPMFTKLPEAIASVPELKELYKNEVAAKEILDYAQKLEGVARHASTHACGVLITKDPLSENVPVQYASTSDQAIVSQYSLHPVEDLGLLKMDFLGLKNLTIIESAIRIIKNTRGLEVDIDSIPLDDQPTYDLFAKGETTGVFQFESAGMKRYLKELRPSEFEDIIAMVALYRPGPMEWIPDYIAGKHGKKKPAYLHPKLEPILRKTYGVAIYQEQVMQMARDLAGFSMGGADVLRKAVGKKIAKLLAEQKIKFIEGCVKNGIDSKLAETIFSFIEPFAGYGFNRSHAACYAMIAYQTAYLKAHWPTEFMAALLSSDQQDSDRVAIEIEECRSMGIEVKQPDINQSFGSFTVVTSGTATNQPVPADEAIKTIRFGLKAIKNVGEHIADTLIAERKQNGIFATLADLLERVDDKDLNKKSLESLIRCGAMDQFGERGQLLANVENFLQYHRDISKAKNNKQTSLFADAPDLAPVTKIKMQDAEPVSNADKLAWEKELLGLYVSEHPFNDYKKRLSNLAMPLSDLRQYKDQEVNVAGVIGTIKSILTRKNERMLFTKIEDGVASVEILVFPKLLKETAAIWQEGRTIICQGTVSDKDNELKILANKASALTLESLEFELDRFAKQEVAKRGTWSKDGFVKNDNNGPVLPPPPPPLPLKLIIQEDQVTSQILTDLKQVLLSHPGSSQVFLKIAQGQTGKIIQLDVLVNNQDKLQAVLAQDFPQIVRVA